MELKQPKTSITTTLSSHPPFLLLLIITLLSSQIPTSQSQQQYVDNNQLDCNTNYNNTDGFLCNGNRTSCVSYLTFRAALSYETAPNIAFLLGSSASDIARINNISDVDPIPADTLLIVPVPCSCSGNSTRARGRSYYQRDANYTLKAQGETYFSVANNTYQGLATCQAMMAQNPGINFRNLTVGEPIRVPLMCACPTARQEREYGARYLLSYLVTWGDDIAHIADKFGADQQSVLDANDLKPDDVIYPFTPILVPLRSQPTRVRFPSSPPAAPPPQANTPPAAGSTGGSSKKWVFIVIGIAAGVFVLSLSSLLVWFFLLRPSKKKPIATVNAGGPKGDKNDPESKSAEYAPLPSSSTGQSTNNKSWSVALEGFKIAIGSLTAYKFSELEKATGKFGEGNRIKGSVFRGKINGDDAAIKILKGSVPADEINLLKHINHSNVIRLSGYCVHEGNTYLVYEFAEKGSLDVWLSRREKPHSEDLSLSPPVLGWKQRVQIACNIADALNYLHSYVNPPYIHKNLTSSNILLDSNFTAKITNFGLARAAAEGGGAFHLTKHVVGTHGYLAPEYIENGVVTPKMDVFSFGVVLLELLSGKPAVRPSGNKDGGADDLLFVVIGKVFEGDDVREKLTGFMDSNLGREYPLDLAYSLANLAHKCVDRDMNSRPSMSEVAMTLSKIFSSSLDWDPSDELDTSSSFSYSR